jgi:hypothetical protein
MTSIAAVTTAPQPLFQPLPPQSGTTAAGSSSTGDPSIDGLIADQQKQIAAGLASGKLTQKQADHLLKGLDAIQKLEQDAQANGPLSDKQQQRLEKLLQRESKRIARATGSSDGDGDDQQSSTTPVTTTPGTSPATGSSTGTQPTTSGGSTLEINIDIKFQETQASVTSDSNGTSLSASQTNFDLSLKVDITV